MKKLLCLVLVAAMLTGCEKPKEVSETQEISNTAKEELVLEEVELSDYEEDALYLVEQVEVLHPCFVMDDTPENYETTRAEYLEAAKQCKNPAEFTVASMKYVRVLNDGHTNIGIQQLCIKLLDLNSIWHEGILWLKDENDLMTDAKILSISGVDPEEIWGVMEELQPFENESAYAFYQHHAMFDGILQLAGVDVSKNEIDVIFEKDGEQYSEKREMLTRSEHAEAYPNSIFSPKETASYEMIGDVFYLDLNHFIDDSTFQQTLSALRESVSNGTEKVIVDLRGNSGGNSLVGTQILKAMGMSEPAYSWYTRNRGSQFVNAFEPLVENKGRANPKVELIVLSDETTFSSGTMFCVWTQDGNLGRVVGRPSANSPNCYGDVMVGKLPNTEISYHISFKYWKRPDQTANTEIFEVDVPVPHSTDAFEVALELLAE